MGQWIMHGPDAPLLTRNEVMAYLHLSPRRLRELIADGRFPAGIPGGKGHMWPAQDVAAWLYLQGRMAAGGPDEPDESDDRKPAPKNSG